MADVLRLAQEEAGQKEKISPVFLKLNEIFTDRTEISDAEFAIAIRERIEKALFKKRKSKVTKQDQFVIEQIVERSELLQDVIKLDEKGIDYMDLFLEQSDAQSKLAQTLLHDSLKKYAREKAKAPTGMKTQRAMVEMYVQYIVLQHKQRQVIETIGEYLGIGAALSD